MGGYANKILRVNLSERSFKEEKLSEELIMNYIGGRGFGIKILFDELEKGIDPLSPENKLIFVNGPLAGTGAQSSSRVAVVTKSPLTGTYLISNCGGYFGAEMKFAGLDIIIVEGKAEKPVYIWIKDNEYEIRDASDVWGIETEETHKVIRRKTSGSARMVVIGPAGEKLVKFASIVSDRRTAGRGGVGAVMGSKNLKAVVVKGSKKPEIAEPDKFRDAVKDQIEYYKESSFFGPFHNLGSGGLTKILYDVGMCPTYNFKQEELPNIENFSPENLGKYVVDHHGCYGCMLTCGKTVKNVKGSYAGIAWDAPEYEAYWSYGPNCGNTNIESIIELNRLSDQYGIDVISAGCVIAFAMELYEKKIITKEDADGLELEWGNYEAMEKLLRKIVLRDGFGDVLAEGVKRAAEKIGKGADKYAIHIKGRELPAYDPRAAKSHGLNLITTPVGPNHNMGWAKQELLGIPKKVDPFTLEGKGELTKYNQDETTIFETGITCIFPPAMTMIIVEIYGKLLSSATGIKKFEDPKYLWKVSERIWNLERLFNVREGFSRKDDSVPERLLNEPIPRKAGKGQIFEQEELLDQYYKARGWDNNGVPTKEKLEELGLGEIAKKLNIK